MGAVHLGEGGIYITNADNVSIDPTITLDASGVNSGDYGASITISGSDVTVAGVAKVDGGTDGNAGTITISAADTLDLSADTVDLTADATGSGNAGTISLSSAEDMTIGSGSTGASVSASSADTGNGGMITATATGAANWAGASLTATAGTSGDGTGGTISVSGDTINAAGEASVDAYNNGTAGSLTLTAANQLEVNGDGFAATAKGNGTGFLGGAGTITLQSTAANIYFSADVSLISDGENIGEVFLNAATDVTSDSGINVAMSASGADLGYGGNIIVLCGGEISVDTAAWSCNAGPGGDGAGGAMTISIVGSGTDITLGGELQSNGTGSGAGGTFTLTSLGELDLSEASVSTDGGESGDGGSLSLTYADSDPVLIGDLSCVTTTGDGIGITISNTENTDMVVTVSGNIQTCDVESIETPDDLLGKIQLNPNDNESNNITFTVDDSGGFASIISAEGASVTINCEPVVALGIGLVTANVGDVTIYAFADESSFSPELAPRQLPPGVNFSSLTDLPGNPAQIESINGAIYVHSTSMQLKTASLDAWPGLITQGQSIVITCRELYLAPNSYLNPNGGTVTIQSFYDLLIRHVPPCGIMNSSGIYIGHAPEAVETYTNVTIEFGLTGVGSLGLEAHNFDSTALCSIETNGSITLNTGLGDTVTGNIPDALNVATTGGEIGVTQFWPFTSGESGMAFSNVGAGADITGYITAYTSGQLLMQSDTNIFINSLTSHGFMEVDANYIGINDGGALLAYAGPVNAGMRLSGSTYISIGISVSIEAYGEIDISQSDSVLPTNVDSNTTRPSAVPASHIHPSAPNSNLYWGDISNVSIAGSGSTVANFTADGVKLVFDMIGQYLSIGPNVTINAHT